MIFLVFLISIILIAGYGLLLMWMHDNFKKINLLQKTKSSNFINVPVTVILAARNEEKNITTCLESLLNQTYLKEYTSIIVVDDHSTDDTKKLIKQFNDKGIIYLRNVADGGKKKAIALGIENSNTDLILTTDADCIVPKNWVEYMVRKYSRTNANFIAGPVINEMGTSLINYFEYVDSLANIVLIACGIHSNMYYLANGANMAFTKSIWEKVGGYTNELVASGDDVMLIQKISNHKDGKIVFLKDTQAVIVTKSCESMKDFVTQRKRWATKTKHYSHNGIVFVQGFVFMIIIYAVLLTVYGVLWGKQFLFCGIFIISTKLIIDLVYVIKIATFYDRSIVYLKMGLSSLLYYPYIILLSFFALFPTEYIWKDRRVQ